MLWMDRASEDGVAKSQHLLRDFEIPGKSLCGVVDCFG